MSVIASSPERTLSERIIVVRVVLVAIGVGVLASPSWLQASWSGSSLFPAVSIVFTLVVAALVASWDRPPPQATIGRAAGAANATSHTVRPGAAVDTEGSRVRRYGLLASIVAGAAAMVLVGLATQRFVDAVLLNPPDPNRGDMLTVIELAGRRFLRGRDPYASYQLPWQVYLPYGPPLWGPFLLPQMLRIDLRLLTASGQLVVPVCCGVVAVFEAARARLISAAACLLLLATFVFNPDLLRFVTVGHTPAYWPLLPLLAILTAGERWHAAAAVLGVLIAGRTTMTALVPVFMMTVWLRDRSRVLSAGLILTAAVLALLLPFLLWDPAAMWRGMVTNYVQGIKQIVWRSNDGGAIYTIGLTGWLLSHGLERFVELSQACALAVVYVLAWRALRRGASALPYMGFGLFAFSMTTVWPVYYVHFDVVVLLASAALAETVAAIPLRRAIGGWAAAIVCAIGLVAGTVRMMAAPAPSIAVDLADGRNLLRHGFSRLEDDGARKYRWIVSTRAVTLLPRSSASAADLVVTAEPFAPKAGGPLTVTAVLNGTSLGTTQVDGGWQALRFRVPASTWRIGANELILDFPPARSPKELGLSDDPRHLVMAVQRIDVEAR
ncbi:MAG: hypothetical protein ABJA98_01425 [Acidobacteriota bacterium]